MTGPECYQEALRLARKAADYQGEPLTSHVQVGQLSQTYALLALAAATALGREGEGRTQPSQDRAAWFDVAAECRKAQS